MHVRRCLPPKMVGSVQWQALNICLKRLQKHEGKDKLHQCKNFTLYKNIDELQACSCGVQQATLFSRRQIVLRPSHFFHAWQKEGCVAGSRPETATGYSTRVKITPLLCTIAMPPPRQGFSSGELETASGRDGLDFIWEATPLPESDNKVKESLMLGLGVIAESGLKQLYRLL